MLFRSLSARTGPYEQTVHFCLRLVGHRVDFRGRRGAPCDIVDCYGLINLAVLNYLWVLVVMLKHLWAVGVLPAAECRSLAAALCCTV